MEEKTLLVPLLLLLLPNEPLYLCKNKIKRTMATINGMPTENVAIVSVFDLSLRLTLKRNKILFSKLI
jgi:hypothetical protein